MQVEIREYSIYNEEEILNLYSGVGWLSFTSQPEMLKNAYAHSLKILGAYVDQQLVGIIRVVGDGFSIVYIQDILVLPEYQRLGIGTSLLEKILVEYKDVYQKVLLTDYTEKTISFYKSVGFKMDSEIGLTAFLKNY